MFKSNGNKNEVKKVVKKIKGDKCALSEKKLPNELSLFDIHRKINEVDGGGLEIENVELADPVVHMKHHGNYRLRPGNVEDLKAAIQDRNNIIRLKNKVANQLLAYRRGVDHPLAGTKVLLKEMLKVIMAEKVRYDKIVSNQLETIGDPFIRAALGVPGVGPITVAYCYCYLDLIGVFEEFDVDERSGKRTKNPRVGQEKMRHASSAWKYVGLHCASHKRYNKGEKGGGNKNLRTALYTFADSQLKHRGPYRTVYDNMKARLEKSEKLTWTRLKGDGGVVQKMWKDVSPGHRHGACMRAMMKHFLADWWYVGRTLLGATTTPIYPEAILGGNHRTIMPEERGWIY